MKLRLSGDGLHFFDRHSGLNVLVDEVDVPTDQQSLAPRFVSFALTNACDLTCPFCYAAKSPASLDLTRLRGWIQELDENGCLGVGFGGGEPTLYPDFVELCRHCTNASDMSVSFTTHGHRLTSGLAEELSGNVNFIRLSMDGVNGTYEYFRQRPFRTFLTQLQLVASVSQFGINFVVNDRTVSELDAAVEIALAAGASEFLLLPEISSQGLSQETTCVMNRWIRDYRGSLRLGISEYGVCDAVPLADPHDADKGLRAYAFVSAHGHVCSNSYDLTTTARIPAEGILSAIFHYEGRIK